MSVADRLGTGSSFGAARSRSARGRAKAIAQGDVPEYELVRLHLSDVAPTPLNPRRNFGTDEEKTRFGEELRAAQLAACVAVTRAAYLNLWPDHETHIGESDWVLVNGERRYRSGVHVGLEALDFVVRNDLASSREEFIDHLLKENLEREDFDVIERARGVQAMVDVCGEESEKGARTRAAERLKKDRSWVTNQLALLSLPDEVQLMLSSGEMPERDGRLLARRHKDHPKLGAADLLSYLKEVRTAEAQERQEERALLQAVKQRKAGGVLSADNTPSPSERVPTQPNLLSADNTTDAEQPLPSGTGAGAPLLSADNTPSPSERVPTQPNLLSADNTPPAPREGGAGMPHVEPAAHTLVQQLGSTPAEQAQTLANGMSPQELEALVKELRTYL